MAAPNMVSPANAVPSVIVSTVLGTTEANVYTASGSACVKIEHAVVCNSSGVPVTVTVGVVPSGGTPGAGHHVLHSFPLPAGVSFPLNDYLKGLWLGAGDSIEAFANLSSDVVLTISGTVFT